MPGATTALLSYLEINVSSAENPELSVTLSSELGARQNTAVLASPNPEPSVTLSSELGVRQNTAVHASPNAASRSHELKITEIKIDCFGYMLSRRMHVQ